MKKQNRWGYCISWLVIIIINGTFSFLLVAPRPIAYAEEVKSSKELKIEIDKIKTYLEDLQVKLERAKAAPKRDLKRIAYLENLIIATKQRLDRVSSAYQEALITEEQRQTAEEKWKEEQRLREEEAKKASVMIIEEVEKTPLRHPVSFNIQGGVIASVPAVLGQIEWPIGMSGFALRAGGGYVKGTDPTNNTITREMVPINGSLVYYAPLDAEGITRTYFLATGMYIAKAEDGGTSGWGAGANIGIESSFGGEDAMRARWFGEVGYGTLKVTNPDRPAFEGMNGLIGFGFYF